jgi:carbon storage regulator
MLVLSRQVNETIRIGNDIVVTISRVRGTTVFVGIDAPKEVPVHRGEVWRAIKRKEEENER